MGGGGSGVRGPRRVQNPRPLPHGDPDGQSDRRVPHRPGDRLSAENRPDRRRRETLHRHRHHRRTLDVQHADLGDARALGEPDRAMARMGLPGREPGGRPGASSNSGSASAGPFCRDPHDDRPNDPRESQMILVESVVGNDPRTRLEDEARTVDAWTSSGWTSGRPRRTASAARRRRASRSPSRSSATRHLHDGDSCLGRGGTDRPSSPASSSRTSWSSASMACSDQPAETLARTCVELGHALGNQHWPAVVKGTGRLRAADRRPQGHGLGDEDPRLRGHHLRVPARRRGHPVPRPARGPPALRRCRFDAPFAPADHSHVCPRAHACRRRGPYYTHTHARARGPGQSRPRRSATHPRHGSDRARSPDLNARGSVPDVPVDALLQFGDSMLPVGAFSFSNGLESAVQHGVVHDAGSLREFVRTATAQSATSDGIAVLAAFRAARGGDVAGIDRADHAVFNRKLNEEMRTMTVRMGRKLAELADRTIGGPRRSATGSAAIKDGDDAGHATRRRRRSSSRPSACRSGRLRRPPVRRGQHDAQRRAAPDEDQLPRRPGDPVRGQRRRRGGLSTGCAALASTTWPRSPRCSTSWPRSTSAPTFACS